MADYYPRCRGYIVEWDDVTQQVSIQYTFDSSPDVIWTATIPATRASNLTLWSIFTFRYDMRIDGLHLYHHRHQVRVTPSDSEIASNTMTITRAWASACRQAEENRIRQQEAAGRRPGSSTVATSSVDSAIREVLNEEFRRLVRDEVHRMRRNGESRRNGRHRR